MVEPLFLRSTVTFVEVPDVGESGEIACREMLGDWLGADGGLVGVADWVGVGDGLVGVADGVGVEDGDAVDDGDGLVGVPASDAAADEPGLVELAEVELAKDLAPPATLTENDLVARPAPPCQSSVPASTSIRYHEFWM